MTALFDIAGTVALVGWALLAASLFLPDGPRSAVALVTGIAIPAVLAVAYVALIVSGWGADPDAGFGSIAAVRALFADDRLLTAGWLHYLAFDLIIGTWLVGAGRAAGVPRLLLLICLPPAFLFAPAGWLAGMVLIGLWKGFRYISPPCTQGGAGGGCVFEDSLPAGTNPPPTPPCFQGGEGSRL